MARVKKIHINSHMYTLVTNSAVDGTTVSCNLTVSASPLSKEKKKKNQNAPKIVNDQNYAALL